MDLANPKEMFTFVPDVESLKRLVAENSYKVTNKN